MKERFDLIASSLSSYFGVGFSTPQEQLDIDLGKAEKIFDDDSQDRMDLGNAMEDGCINYFEKKMGIKIDERNSEYAYAVNGLLKCKRDGRTYLEGVETGWENKYSNSYSCFTDDLGYEIQCQAYMMAFGLDQWVLAGMWQGKPAYKLIKKNEELQKDIEIIVMAVADILNGLSTIEEYPWDIVEKYSSQKQLIELDETMLDKDDKEIFNAMGKLKDKKKVIEDKIKELEEYVKATFADSKYEDDDYKYTITSSEGKKSFDKNLFSIENPIFDLSKYEKVGAGYRMIRVTPKKKAGMVK